MNRRQSASPTNQQIRKKGILQRFLNILTILACIILLLTLIIFLIFLVKVFFGYSTDFRLALFGLVLAIAFGIPQALAALIQMARDPALPKDKVRSLLNFRHRLLVTLRNDKPIWGRPPVVNLNRKYFIDKGFLKNIHATILQSKNPVANRQPLAITGGIGMGKTQTIFQYAAHYGSFYTQVLWINASSYDECILSCIEIYENIMQSQSTTIAGFSVGIEYVDAIKQWLQDRERNKGWLLVLDKCDITFGNKPGPNDPADRIALRKILEEFLGLAQYGTVVLTTKEQFLPGYIENLPIPAWEPDDGASFLLSRIEEKRTPELLEQTREISEELDNLPLALEFAAASINIENGGSLERFLQRYKTKRGELTHYVHRGYPQSLSATILVFFQEVQPVERLLHLCAVLAHAPIPREIIVQAQAATFDVAPFKGDIDEVMKTLGNLPFIELETKASILRMGHLLQMIIIDDKMDGNTQQEYAKLAVSVLNTAFTKAQFEDWQHIHLYFPHAQTCANYIDTFQIESIEAIQLLNITGHYLRQYARYTEAGQILEQAEVLCEKMSKKQIPHDLERATCLNYQGEVYHSLGQYQRALNLYRQSERITHTASVLNNLGSFFDDWRELNSTNAPDRNKLTYHDYAVKDYQEALDICKQHFNPQDRSVICDMMFSLSNLAWCYYEYDDEKYTLAKKLLTEASSIFKLILGTDYKNDVQDYQVLPVEQSDWHIYEQIFTDILQVFKNIFKTQYDIDAHPYTAECYSHLAVLYAIHGESKKAIKYFEVVVSIGEKYLGKNHPLVAKWLNNLAEQHYCRVEYANAKKLYHQAMDIYLYRQTLGENHLSLAYIKDNYDYLPASIRKAQYATVNSSKIKEQAKQIATKGF